MNAPTPQSKTFEFQKEVDPYFVIIQSDTTTMTITVRKEEEIPKKKFTTKFQFGEFMKMSKWFSLFDTMESISSEIGCLFTDGKIKLVEEHEKINLYLLIQLRQIEDIVLEIPQVDVQNNESLIEDICTTINALSKKIKLQEEKFKLLELSSDYKKMYQEGLKKNK